MDSKDLILRLLYYCLIDIRFEAIQTKSNKIYWISNLLHNIPMQMKNALTAEDYDKILQHIEVTVEHDNKQEWYKTAMDNVSRHKAMEDELNKKE